MGVMREAGISFDQLAVLPIALAHSELSRLRLKLTQIAGSNGERRAAQIESLSSLLTELRQKSY